MLESPGKVFSRDDIRKIINISKERTISISFGKSPKKFLFSYQFLAINIRRISRILIILIL